MDAVEFLASNVVALPKERTDDDFLSYVRRVLSDYQLQMRQVRNRSLIEQVITTRIEYVEDISRRILECIERYLRGHPAAAYQSLDDSLVRLGAHFDILCPSADMSAFVNPMYRFRTDIIDSVQANEFFHIPFQLRHIVASMRYSIPGLPALYLGGSTNVCWLELGKPDLKDVTVSRFEALPNTHLKILNFGYRPERLAAWIQDAPDEFRELNSSTAIIGSFVACWPLIALCSIRKKQSNAKFHAEYILPQLVLQWITNTRNFHGVRYFSTHCQEYYDDPKTSMNYVFPALSVNSTGVCPELCKLFGLTKPTRWSHAKAEKRTNLTRPHYKYKGELNLDLENEFGHVESVLLSKSVLTLP
jgi:hypothetical protein